MRIDYHHLTDLFIKKSDQMLYLDPLIGKGEVQIFKLEPGLQACLWDCCLKNKIELGSFAESAVPSTYLTIANFENTNELRLTNAKAINTHHRMWDQLFFTSVSDHSLNVSTGIRVRCFTISFSKKWLDRAIADNGSLVAIGEKISAARTIAIAGSMKTSEKELMLQMFNSPVGGQLGSFSIKSVVFKFIADYLNRLNEEDGFNFDRLRSLDFLEESEGYLLKHIREPLPDLKSLASQFGMSESTFRRQFKKRYGLTMSAFFIKSKMEYARQLLNQNNPISKVAKLVGYQSVEKFTAMYKRYYKLSRK